MSQQPDPALMKRSATRAALVAGGIFGAVLVLGTYTRVADSTDLKKWTSEAAIPTVQLISPAADGKALPLVLPGSLQAFYDAPIHSRVPGYVSAWYKDIGARVKKGDLLATIDTPELDQQISQARADLDAAVAREQLSSTTAQRWRNLLPLDAVSKQDVEEKEAELSSRTGAVKAAQANRDRLVATKDFARIVAPFDGVITSRNIDIGALVSGGASGGEPLFSVASLDRLRLYVNVPQAYSAQIVPGMTATLTVPEYPGKVFPATLVSTSNAISRSSASLLVQFEAANPDGLLKPGGYATVSMTSPQAGGTLRLPASALMFRASGLQVATLGKDNRIVMKSITVGTDQGSEITVAAGLAPADRVINNPPDSLAAGDAVRVGTGSDAR